MKRWANLFTSRGDQAKESSTDPASAPPASSPPAPRLNQPLSEKTKGAVPSSFFAREEWFRSKRQESPPAAALAAVPPRNEGWCQVKQGRFAAWRPAWCTLDERWMELRPAAPDATSQPPAAATPPFKKIDLVGCHLIGGSNPGELTIKEGASGGGTICFRPPSPAQRDEWMVGLGSVAGLFRQASDYYTVGRTWGHGATCEVQECVGRFSRRRLALKRRVRTTREATAAMHNELRILQICAKHPHPAIPQLEDFFFDTEGRIELVMALMEGGELFHWVAARERLGEGEARGVFRQVAAGVAHLHALGIAHRDLKPSNLMYVSDPGSNAQTPHTHGAAQEVAPGMTVRSSPPSGSSSSNGQASAHAPSGANSAAGTAGRGSPHAAAAGGALRGDGDALGPSPAIKIMDFDLARVNYSPEWEGATPCGTVHYMAPEVVRCQRYSLAVDVWSLGVILYVLLSGRMPFDGSDARAVQRAIDKGEYRMDAEQWAGVSEEAKDLVRRLLAMDPAQRPTAQECLQHPWLAGANEETPATATAAATQGAAHDGPALHTAANLRALSGSLRGPPSGSSAGSGEILPRAESPQRGTSFVKKLRAVGTALGGSPRKQARGGDPALRAALDYDLGPVRQRHEAGDEEQGSVHIGGARSAEFQDYLALEKLKVQLDMVGTEAGILDSRAMAAKGGLTPSGSPTAAGAARSPRAMQQRQRGAHDFGAFHDLEATHVETEGE